MTFVSSIQTVWCTHSYSLTHIVPVPLDLVRQNVIVRQHLLKVHYLDKGLLTPLHLLLERLRQSFSFNNMDAIDLALIRLADLPRAFMTSQADSRGITSS